MQNVCIQYYEMTACLRDHTDINNIFQQLYNKTIQNHFQKSESGASLVSRQQANVYICIITGADSPVHFAANSAANQTQAKLL